MRNKPIALAHLCQQPQTIGSRLSLSGWQHRQDAIGHIAAKPPGKVRKPTHHPTPQPRNLKRQEQAASFGPGKDFIKLRVRGLQHALRKWRKEVVTSALARLFQPIALWYRR